MNIDFLGRTCVQCDERNMRTNKYAHLHCFRAKRPFNEININFIGEYQPTKNGNMFAMTAIDQLSQFVIASPCQTKQLTVNKAFLRHMCQYLGHISLPYLITIQIFKKHSKRWAEILGLCHDFLT